MICQDVGAVWLSSKYYQLLTVNAKAEINSRDDTFQLQPFKHEDTHHAVSGNKVNPEGNPHTQSPGLGCDWCQLWLSSQAESPQKTSSEDCTAFDPPQTYLPEAQESPAEQVLIITILLIVCG